MFFPDEAAVCIVLVQAADAAPAETLVTQEHPGGKVHAVDGALVTQENRFRMPGKRLNGED